ncbi:Uncharacterised protein [uncultured archaeon]|nr:Uncharacterised protein [uncultured archaeon]
MNLKVDLGNKRTIAGAIVLICIIALVIYSPTIIHYTNPSVCTVNGVCEHEQRLILLEDLIPLFILIGVAIGAVVFFFMSSRIEGTKQDMKKVTDALIQFLGKDEKQVVQKLLENHGKILQAEVSRIEGIGKLKSHRIIRRLADRGVIEIEGFGKTNIIKLAKGINEVLIEKK